MREVAAIFVKEWRSEMRSRHGLFASGLFAFLAVVAMGFSTQGQQPAPTLAAGMLTLTLLFSASVTLPRTFVAEDEQGTLDLLRLIAAPGAAFLGKALYNLVQMAVAGVVLGLLFAMLTGVPVPHPGLLAAGILVEAVALAGAMSLCGALVAGASNRWVLSAAVSLPLLLPQTALSIGVLRVALGEGSWSGGLQNLAGLGGFAAASFASAPLLVGLVWQRR